MHAHLAQEVDVVELGQPIGVVDDQGLALGKVQEAAHLLLDALHVVVDVLGGEHLAKLALAGGVADQARAAAHQGDGPVAGPLHVGHGHDGDVVADVQGVGRGVKAHVEGDGTLLHALVQVFLVDGLGDEAALLQNVQGVLRHFYRILSYMGWGDLAKALGEEQGP